ncbi:MAG: phosphatidate cytidylyltransferase [Pirellulales bacterium]|nr:phosphatidate cytidylyltransferase [Pirellulales bacterium]
MSLIGAVLVLLGAAEVIVWALRRNPSGNIDAAILETFRLRVHAWWILLATLATAFLLGHVVTVVLFGLISFWALREFITLTPTRPGDHTTLFLVFTVVPLLQYVLVGLGAYGLYIIFIPVYVFLLIPPMIALSGDYKRFLERTAKIQVGLLICVYCLSYAPALLTLKLPELAPGVADSGGNVRLLFFFVLVVQLSDALQYAWSQSPNKHVIVPTINTTRTWEGLLGGTASVTLIAAALWWATPFHGPKWWMAAAMGAVISLMCFAGGITMSAIKRDRGVSDFGTLVEGHGGVLDRIDSLCFAAPVFFHCTRWWLMQM